MNYRDNAQPSNIVSGEFGTEVITLVGDDAVQGADQDCREVTIWTPDTVSLSPDSSSPNIITNGNFTDWTADNPDDWTLYGDGLPEDGSNYVNEDAGKCKMISAAGMFVGIQQQSLTLGKIYRVTVTVSGISGLGGHILCGSTGTVSNLTTNGVKDLTMACAGDTVLHIRTSSTGGAAITIDDLVIEEINMIPTDAPIRIPISNTNKLHFRGLAGDVVNIIWRS